MIHTTGVRALDNIANSQGCTDISQLINENADYVAYYINISLKRVGQE